MVYLVRLASKASPDQLEASVLWETQDNQGQMVRLVNLDLPDHKERQDCEAILDRLDRLGITETLVVQVLQVC